MKLFRKLGMSAAAIALLLVLLLLCACGKTETPQEQPKQEQQTSASSDAEKTPDEAEGETVYISGLVETKTEDDLFAQSVLVAFGTVGESSEAFQVRSASGMTANYTDYTFTIEKTYRGEAQSGTVTVRVEGGTAGGRTEIYSPTADLEDGKEYLLFLYQPNFGGDCYTRGNYYCVLGLHQGVFTEAEDGGFISQAGTALSMRTLLDRAEEFPIDAQYFRNQFIENQSRNLETGFITQKEYDDLMSTLDVYAEVVQTDADRD